MKSDPPVSSSESSALLRIVIPFVLCGIYILLLFLLLRPQEFATMIGLIIAYLLPPAGKETVIPLGVAVGLPWWLVALTMALFDMFGALFMALNFTFSLKIPVLGGWIQRTMDEGRVFFDERPWLERLYSLGLLLFVMIPFEGSGGITASLIGRIMGLRTWEVFAFITVGAFASCFLIALGSEYALAYLERYFTGGLEILVILLISILFLIVLRNAFKKKKKEAIK